MSGTLLPCQADPSGSGTFSSSDVAGIVLTNSTGLLSASMSLKRFMPGPTVQCGSTTSHSRIRRRKITQKNIFETDCCRDHHLRASEPLLCSLKKNTTEIAPPKRCTALVSLVHPRVSRVIVPKGVIETPIPGTHQRLFEVREERSATWVEFGSKRKGQKTNSLNSMLGTPFWHYQWGNTGQLTTSASDLLASLWRGHLAARYHLFGGKLEEALATISWGICCFMGLKWLWIKALGTYLWDDYPPF